MGLNKNYGTGNVTGIWKTGCKKEIGSKLFLEIMRSEYIGTYRDSATTIRTLASWHDKGAEVRNARSNETLTGMAGNAVKNIMLAYDQVFGKVEKLVDEGRGERVAMEAAVGFIVSLCTCFEYVANDKDVDRMLPAAIDSLSSICRVFRVKKPKALQLLIEKQSGGGAGALTIPLLASAAGSLSDAIKNTRL